MLSIGYTNATWFHAANSAALMEDALRQMHTALENFMASREASHSEVVKTFGIEIDVRAIYRDPKKVKTDTPVGWIAVLHHDAFTDAQLHDACDADDMPAHLLTLEQCFAMIVQSPWFARQAQRHELSAQNASTTAADVDRLLFRLILKLDFKDPRAAETFHRHTCAGAEDGVWHSYRQLCDVLRPSGELSVWWNADVVPSDLLLNDQRAQRQYAQVQEATRVASVFDYTLEAHPALRFIDIPLPLLIDLIRRTVAHNRIATVGDCAATPLSVGLSLGWVLKLPVSANDVSGYRAHAPYRSGDTARMAQFVSAMWAALVGTDNATTPELVTYAVLWEAVFTPERLLQSLCSTTESATLPWRGEADPAETEEDSDACDALTGLMHHTQRLLTERASTTPCDSPRGFLTLWKVRGAETRGDTRARTYFPWSTIDG